MSASGKYSIASKSKKMNRFSLVLLIVFAAIVAFLGGASRYDAVQNIPLRSLSAIFLIPGFLFLTQSVLRRELIIVGSMAILVFIMALQLIPLPHSLWSALPARGSISAMDAMLGADMTWRPLTLAPMRTWNALNSLVVPLAALLLAISLSHGARLLLQIIAGVGILNAIIGTFQVVSGQFSPFYLYALTNHGSPVGIFANENHAATFGACSLLIIARLGIQSQRERSAKWQVIGYSGAFVFVLSVALFSGSRAGLAANVGAFLMSIVMLWLSRSDKPRRYRKSETNFLLTSPLFLTSLFIGIVLCMLAFFMSGKAPAIENIVAKDSFADLRWSILPIELEMVKTFWLFGSGFGSFEQTYKIFEPAELLMPMYVNQAHNDWLQFLIEGGLVAACLLFGIHFWIVRRVSQLAGARRDRVQSLFWMSLFGVIAAASFVDYPLRTPIFQVAGVWLLVALSRDSRGEESASAKASCSD